MLPLAAPWVKAPTMVLSLMAREAKIQTPMNMSDVPIRQKAQNFGSMTSVIGEFAISLKSRTGSETLNTNLLITETKFSLNIPFCLRI